MNKKMKLMNQMKLRTTARASVTALISCCLLSACALGPDYVRPDLAAPAGFKEGRADIASPQSPEMVEGKSKTGVVTGVATGVTVVTTGPAWRLAQPNDEATRGKWWEVFGDTQLNALQEQLVISNQNVAQAEAQFRAARAQLDSATAAEFPSLNLSASERRSGPANAGGTFGTSTGTGTGTGSTTGATVARGKTDTLSVGLSWEVDVWGRLRRTAESRSGAALASKADLAGALLSAQTDLTNNYFKLRLTDAQKDLLKQTLDGYQKSLDLTRNRYAGGVAARADVVQAETQYKSTLVQAIDLDVQRTQYEHAIALLLGKAASDFAIPATPLNLDQPTLPTVPSAGLPSELIERRPDIAGAERRMMSANASIGAAQAAFFPTLSLTGSNGYSSSGLTNLISAANRTWSFGPSLALNLFDAGGQRAAKRQAEANYDASVATYRQTVLNGFKEVEDYLAQLRIYEREADAQYDALQSARESLALVINQYKAGTVSYLNVITAQATALSAERNAANLLGNRLTATILLIKALGGGWNTTDLNTLALNK